MKSFREVLKKESLDFLYTEDLISIQYFTGMQVSKGALFLAKKESRFFVDTRYLERAKKESKIKVEILSWEKIRAFLGKKRRIGFSKESLTLEAFEKLQKHLRGKWSPSSFFSTARMIKSPSEREKMKASAALNYEGYLHLVKKVKEGISEEELSWEFEKFCREKKAEKMAFDPIIAFGENSAIPHWRSSTKRLKKGEMVLFDLGVIKEGYASDLTRTHCYKKPSPAMQKLYNLVKKAKKKVLQKIRSGVRIGDLDLYVREIFKKEGQEKRFLHSLGHGVGLEVHEFPKIASSCEEKDFLLQEGMFITIEPGLYKEKEAGVRLEDTIEVTKQGFINLYPEEKGFIIE